MSLRKARVVTFLAPDMFPVYEGTIAYVSRKLRYPMELVAGTHYGEIQDADFCFVCGLPYVLRTPPRMQTSLLTALVAPVLRGDRYRGRPIYFSDVIVHRNSPFHAFAELRGCSWAYNEPESQSGYGITRYWLALRGETNGYFGQVVKAGFHQRAIRMVAEGQVQASAIDSLVLAIELRDHPELVPQLRVIESLGPSTIQPFAATSRVPPSLRQDIQAVLTEMHQDRDAKALLERGFIDRFVAVQDQDYDDIRQMLGMCESAGFLVLR
jgi:phosphonate transport system substrate-binding protein